MIKRILLPVIILSMLSADVTADKKKSRSHKEKVRKQHESDLKKRDEILKRMNAFLKESGTAIADTGLVLGTPVENDLIEDVKETEEMHTSGVILPKIYGYVNTKSLNMRSGDSSSAEITEKLAFKDKVEIIGQSDNVETVKGMTAPWLLVRKSNGDEGWVFGAYISDEVPSEPDRESGKTDWNMIIPVSGKITSKFGKRVDPVTKRRNTFHKGMDISAPEGTPVHAAEEGVVIKAEYVKSGYGNLIIIKHADNIATYYGHLSKFEIKAGQKVKKGDIIGRVGSTGKSTGPHLHFEVRRGDQALDPEQFIR